MVEQKRGQRGQARGLAAEALAAGRIPPELEEEVRAALEEARAAGRAMAGAQYRLWRLLGQSGVVVLSAPLEPAEGTAQRFTEREELDPVSAGVLARLRGPGKKKEAADLEARIRARLVRAA